MFFKLLQPHNAFTPRLTIDKQELVFRDDESKGVKWIDIKEATSEEIVHFARAVNKKNLERLGLIK